MVSNQTLAIVFYWVLPLSIALGTFFIALKIAHVSYERADNDRIWKFSLTVGIIVGLMGLAYFVFTTVPIFKEILHYLKYGLDLVLGLPVLAPIKQQITVGINTVINFIKNWLPVYVRAFIIIWLPACAVWVQSLIWRIKFSRALNVIVQTIVMYPVLCFRYLLGYQTPFFDFVQSRLYVTKVKENISDSYFEALQGRDDTGKEFDKGQGGTERNQKIKSVALAVRQTHAVVKTANGVRHAQIVIRHSRETATDQVLEQQLKGQGLRLSAPSIRFQEDPLLNPDKGGYIFDSDVQYNPSDALGSWLGIFTNPFSADKRIKNGGIGAIATMKQMYLGIIYYLVHLTPSAIYERAKTIAKDKYTPDLTSSRSKYQAQQNLDLSVVPEPVDQDTGETVDMLKEKALKVANDRTSEVTDALTRYKINVSFDNVQVGGNTAVYDYTLSRSTNLPTDWKKTQEGLANFLKTSDIPIIRTTKGHLLVTMVNGVNIPVDFREMIEKRPKGVPEIISGLAGLDAMGNVIDFVLGDKNPHAMLFGKTGTGKTVLIMNILYSIMSATDPKHLKIVYIDGKGNSFEFMRTDNPGAPSYHPNPFVYAQPADGSGDIDYARALVQHMVRECRRRIDLFKKKGVSKLSEFNRKFPEEALPEILMIVDEFSALTDSDATLKASELAEKGMTDAFEYLAKMARSVGIRMILANQTARKEKVPGRITANVTGRISLGVSETIESDIALPSSDVDVSLISQPGEFYSAMHGPRNLQHGNAPYLSDDVMYALNDSLEKKFGHQDYVVTRDEVMKEMGESGDVSENETTYLYPLPPTMPTVNTPVLDLINVINAYPEWAIANSKSDIFMRNKEIQSGLDNKERQRKAKLIKNTLIAAAEKAEDNKKARLASQHKAVGDAVATTTAGMDGEAM